MRDLFTTVESLQELSDYSPERRSKVKTINAFDPTGLIHDFRIFEGCENVESVFIKSNMFPALPSGLFDNFPKLSIVSVSFNQLERIPEDLFSKNNYLENVAFYCTRITQIPSDLFACNPHLREVTFDKGRLTTVPEDLFKNNPNIVECSFSYNKLCIDSPIRLRENVHILSSHQCYVLSAIESSLLSTGYSISAGCRVFISPAEAFQHWNSKLRQTYSCDHVERAQKFIEALKKHFPEKVF